MPLNEEYEQDNQNDYYEQYEQYEQTFNTNYYVVKHTIETMKYTEDEWYKLDSKTQQKYIQNYLNCHIFEKL